VVEGARLESVYTGNRIEGSNPSVSAFDRRSLSVGDLCFLLHLYYFGRPSADAVRYIIIKTYQRFKYKNSSSVAEALAKAISAFYCICIISGDLRRTRSAGTISKEVKSTQSLNCVLFVCTDHQIAPIYSKNW
jgi:hypothetical protein